MKKTLLVTWALTLSLIASPLKELVSKAYWSIYATKGMKLEKVSALYGGSKNSAYAIAKVNKRIESMHKLGLDTSKVTALQVMTRQYNIARTILTDSSKAIWHYNKETGKALALSKAESQLFVFDIAQHRCVSSYPSKHINNGVLIEGKKLYKVLAKLLSYNMSKRMDLLKQV